MTTYDLEILIRTKKTGDDPSPPPDSGFKWTELASKVSLAKQAFDTVAAGAKIAYDNIKAGAELEAARGRFDNLTQTINTTGDALLGKLKEATKGMVSDAELIAGASDIISLGLAKNEGDTVRLATAVSTLGLDMQQVILTFANNSKARLDSLGLSVEGVTQKAAELEAQGFQGDAFDEAVLIGLEEKMTLLGDASETTAGQMQILEAQLQNIKDAGQQALAEGLSPTIAGLSQTVDALSGDVASGRSGWENFIIVVDETAKALNRSDPILNKWTESIKEGDAAIQQNNMRSNQQALALQLEADLRAQATQEIINYSAASAAAAGPNEDLADKVLQTANHLSEEEAALIRAQNKVDALSEAARGGSTAEERYATAVANSSDRLQESARINAEAAAQRAILAAQTGDLFTAFSEADGALKFFNEDLDSLGEQYLTVGGRSAEQNEDLGRLQDAYDKASRTIRDYEIGLKGANLTDEERAEKIAEQQELMNGLTESMSPLLGISGDLVSVNNQLSINQDAVTKAMISAADAAGADAGQIALLKVATGELTPVQAEAVIKSVALEQTLKNLGEQYANGELSLNGYMQAAQQAVSDINEMTVSFDTQTGAISTSNAEAAALIDTLGRLPTSHDFVIKIRTEGAAAIPTGPGSGQEAIPEQLGGPFSPGGLYRVGEGNLPEIGMLQSSGKLFMIPGERGQVFGNSQAKGMLGGYVDQSQINIVNNNLEAAATTNALVQERRRARLDSYMGVG